MDTTNSILTEEELKQGWHWCTEFDGFLRSNKEEKDSGFKCDCMRDTPYADVY